MDSCFRRNDKTNINKKPFRIGKALIVFYNLLSVNDDVLLHPLLKECFEAQNLHHVLVYYNRKTNDIHEEFHHPNFREYVLLVLSTLKCLISKDFELFSFHRIYCRRNSIKILAEKHLQQLQIV